MQFSVRFLCLLLAAAAPIAARAASPFVDAAARLNGTWEGDGYVLQVDSQRAQASVDPERPFHWERFLVKDVSDDKVTFTVGAELYEAKLAADSLTLTSTSFRGERTLKREGPSATP
jgi:hypothetical protein